MTIPSSSVWLSLDEAYNLSRDVLSRNGMNGQYAAAVVQSVVAGQCDECYLYGMYRLMLVWAKGLRSGKVSGNA